MVRQTKLPTMPKRTSSVSRLDLDRYRGQWLALDPKTRRVVASGRTVKAVREAARRKGLTQPVLHGVPTSDAYFVGPLA